MTSSRNNNENMPTRQGTSRSHSFHPYTRPSISSKPERPQLSIFEPVELPHQVFDDHLGWASQHNPTRVAPISRSAYRSKRPSDIKLPSPGFAKSYPTPALTGCSAFTTSRLPTPNIVDAIPQISTLDSGTHVKTNDHMRSRTAPAAILEIRGWTPLGASPTGNDMVQSPADLRKEIHSLIAGNAKASPEHLDYLINSLTSPCLSGNSLSSGSISSTVSSNIPTPSPCPSVLAPLPLVDTPTRPSAGKSRDTSEDNVLQPLIWGNGRNRERSLQSKGQGTDKIQSQPQQSKSTAPWGLFPPQPKINYFVNSPLPQDAIPVQPIRLTYVERFEDPLPIPDFSELNDEMKDVSMTVTEREILDFTPRKPSLDVLM